MQFFSDSRRISYSSTLQNQPVSVWFALIVLLVISCLCAELAIAQPTDSRTTSVSFSAPASWNRFKHSSGVGLSHPRGWQVKVDSKQGQVQLNGTGAQKLVIWPIFIRGPVSNELSSRILTRLAQQIEPETAWKEPEHFDDGRVRIISAADQREAIAGLAWVPSRSGSAGMFYMAATQVGDYRRNERTFSGILRSFQIAGPDLNTVSAGPGIELVPWQDPNENAFSINVPRDWQVSGGMRRFAAVDTRYGITAISPDGEVRVYVGDAEVPPHVVPNEVLELAGFPEGSLYSPGFGVTFLVQPYLPGSDFALHYVSNYIAKDCSDLKYQTVRSREDASQGINGVYQRYMNNGMPHMRFDAGEVIYTCRAKTQSKNGYAFAGTLLVEQDAGGLWSVDWNYGYLASPERAGDAEHVLKQMIDSFRIHPEWARTQSHLTANVSSIVAETGHHISELINNTYESRQFTLDEVFRRYGNAILEVDDVIGPDGTVYQVQSGNNFYWIDPRGNIIGTDTHMRPAIDFQELLRLP